MKSIIEGLKNDKLCIGCGFCESVCGKDAVEMQLDSDGFFRPNVKQIIPELEKVIDSICPGKNVVNDLKFRSGENVWGRLEKLYSGYSTNEKTRTLGSSGGIVSGLSIFILENGLSDAILQVGGDKLDYERNTLNISKSTQDIHDSASSRYAPALIFDKIFDILNANEDTYTFIGKPCDISGLKNFLNYYPQFSKRFKYTISIICAGMPSFKGTKSIIDEFTSALPVTDLVYRGNGWPGYFSFRDSKGDTFQKTYNNSWGSTLNRHLNFRCKICPDGIGLQADIAVGDAWETKDGYPDFAEKDGHSLIMVRTEDGLDLVSKAIQSSSIVCKTIEKDIIQIMQPYQYARRKRIGARMTALNLIKGRSVVNFKHMSILKNTFLESPVILAKEFWGTMKRLIK